MVDEAKVKYICDIYDWDGKGEIDLFFLGDVMYALGLNITKKVRHAVNPQPSSTFSLTHALAMQLCCCVVVDLNPNILMIFSLPTCHDDSLFSGLCRPGSD